MTPLLGRVGASASAWFAEDPRQLPARNLLATGALGLLGSLAVAAGGQPKSLDGVNALGAWVTRSIPLAGTLLPAAALCGSVALIGFWYLMWRAAQAESIGWPTLVGLTALVWAPIVAVSPIISGDAYTYLAQGRLQDAGLNPYKVGPDALGWDPAAALVDHRWRASLSPYGPVWTLFERLVAFGHPGSGASLIVLRWLSVGAVAATIWLLLRLCRPDERPLVYVLTALNPVVILYLVGGMHAEVLIVLLLAAALLARRRGHPLVGYVLLSLAAGVKAPTVLVLLAYLLVDLRSDPRRRITGPLVAISGTWAVLALPVHDVFGWIPALRTPGESRTYDAPTNLVAFALTHAAHWFDWSVQFSTVLAACRFLGAIAGLAVIGWLLATASRRPTLETAGLAMLAAAAFGPVFYPWYLAGPIFLLALLPRSPTALATMVICAVAALSSLPPVRHAGLLAQAFVVVVGCTVSWAVFAVTRSETRAKDPVRTR